jgi:hypothetical protein
MDKHDVMMKTCDPMNSECEFTTADGCEAETGDCSCTVWDLIEQLAAISSRRDELERWYSEHVASTAQLRDDLAAALASEKAVIADSNQIVKYLKEELAAAQKDKDYYYKAYLVEMGAHKAANERIAELEKARERHFTIPQHILDSMEGEQ